MYAGDVIKDFQFMRTLLPADAEDHFKQIPFGPIRVLDVVDPKMPKGIENENKNTPDQIDLALLGAPPIIPANLSPTSNSTPRVEGHSIVQP